MKPFRGKPKKPKRSNGEIHRQRRWLRVGGRCPAGPRGPRAGTLPCVDVRRYSSSCTSPLVERRDPLGVGLRPVADASPVKRHASNPRSPGRLPGGTRKVSGRTLRDPPRGGFREVRRGRRKRAPRYTEANGPSAVTGPGPLLVVRLTFDRPTNVPPTHTGARHSRRGADTGRRRYCFGYS